MIFCETGGIAVEDFDSLVVFVSQARGCGLPAVISTRSIPPDLRASHQFDAAPFLSDAPIQSTDTIILLDAHKIDAARAAGLRELANGAAVNALIFGAFDNRQSEITVTSRVAYALNIQPEIVSPTTLSLLPPCHTPIFAAPVHKQTRKKPVIGLFAPDLESQFARAQLQALNLSRSFDIEIITTGSAKKKWSEINGFEIPVWHLGELLPRALAARFDLLIAFAQPNAWVRMQMLLANLCRQGATIIDATACQSWSSQEEAIIAGPAHLADLSDWLERTIVPNFAAIQTATKAADLYKAFQLPVALAKLRLEITSTGLNSPTPKGSVLFMPTNGVGLGHAKRCSLVADAMRDQAIAKFAAFPSCIGMLTASGFDAVPLVSKSAYRAAHDNDLVNFGRLSPLARDASVIVFDGGYVFDSVMRAAADKARPSIWIRRGLWQAGQNNEIALDRQKTFSRIIVPTEAFDELNGPRETAENIRYVGPIVQKSSMSVKEKRKLRNRLSDELKVTGKKLVVTMLGGGVAADRRAQINAICAHFEGRDEIMHLLVVWPTATTDPAWFHYENTRVVQSVHASVLIPLADLFVSAVGYNSFHEAIYANVPTVFIPQMASFMDDQRARGQAAADRELAVLIEPWEMLSLTKAIDDCLEERGEYLRENLRKFNLPQTGTDAAARHILEYVE